MKIFDYLIVGSGCAGAMAAQTLVEAGVEVAMLDVGITNEDSSAKVPDQDFLTLRESDPEQHRYFIGNAAEGVAVGELGKGAQVTPPRRHMLDGVATYAPLSSTTFSPLESLGYGGLGIGWGLQCWEFSSADMQRTGLPANRMAEAYETVSARIGVSATRDAAAAYTIGNLQTYQPSARMDKNHRLLHRNYQRRQKHFQRQGLYVGRTPLALLTRNLNGRQAYQYRDMDFYSDNDRSAWRPWITIDTLRNADNFTYIGNQLVTRFEEKGEVVTVYCLNVKTKQMAQFSCKQLILASSTLGTARIVLRSVGSDKSQLPFMCNPHAYIPCVQPALLGQGAEPHKLGLGELSYFIDEAGTDSGQSVASSYGYQSLMMFRLINQVPLDFASARPILQYLMSSFVIMIVQHPDAQSPDKYVKLTLDKKSPTGDKLFAKYVLARAEEDRWNKREKQYIRAMRQLHAYALKRVKTEHGASVHYAGTLPFSNKETPLTLSSHGRLHGTRHVYVADSSGFQYLPAKGLTFSLLANAHLTAENVLHGKS